VSFFYQNVKNKLVTTLVYSNESSSMEMSLSGAMLFNLILTPMLMGKDLTDMIVNG